MNNSMVNSDSVLHVASFNSEMNSAQGRSQQIKKGVSLSSENGPARTSISVHVSRTLPKIHCKTLINHHYIPSTSVQTISSTIYPPMHISMTNQTAKAKFCAPPFLYSLSPYHTGCVSWLNLASSFS